MSSTDEEHVDDHSPQQTPPARGMRSLTADTFSFGEAVGGVRGVVEAVLPGLVFVVVFVITEDLTPSLVASAAAALVAVVARLVQRTPVTQALGGILGIAVGVFWAWRSGEAQDFYVWGLWTNAAYLLAFIVSIVVRWPLVGLFVEAIRAGFSDPARRVESSAEDSASADDQPERSPFAALADWRSDPDLVRRYTIASWFWVGLFAIRLAVKVPLYLTGDVGWLGTMHLVLGVPLWGLVLWLTWVVVRGAHAKAGQTVD
ncbi:uncharacterized protein DUF3159 [Isoptericola sp. CG 20/1183]|uniref:Uncharacterized protein DUF3159 n=1 Tax=Isoptericola halotolerans TaxID=300560 RepID=A0ABX5EEQ1_9MICO|nr:MULTISPECIES: DUF3159 domain-containing protein [Isoptericola]PRZ03836.1 uncharacterized protein DUF3159 [Isoptericola sp. CG 20/1183]PRZ04031.1 uncharacterized protein DUF3159 [Isoptericola halotolerans]